jgi:hypothetical protein
MREPGLPCGLTLETVIDKLFRDAPKPTKAKKRESMKTLPHSFATAVAGVGRCGLTGHNPISISTMKALGVPTYPHSLRPASIRILTKPRTRPDVRLHDIQAEPSSDSVPAAEIAPSLQYADAKLGADAVVIAYDRIQRLGAWVTGPWFGRSIQTYSGCVISSVAINYQRPENEFAGKRPAL